MDIVSYLLELIETRKNVGINAFGTLYKKKTPGRYDSETHSFLPPKYEIAFTNEIKESEDLVHFISEKRNISTDSAEYYITEFVENIQAQLADHQEADFSPLGKLKLINDQIVLASSHDIKIGFSSFGLPSVSSQLDQSQSDTENDEAIAEDTQEIQPIAEQDEQPVFDEISEINNIQEDNEIEERVDLEQEGGATNFSQHEIENEETISSSSGILDPLWKPTVISRYEYDEEDEDDNKNTWLRTTLKVVLALFVFIIATGVFIYFVYPDLFHTAKEKFTTSASLEHEAIPMVDTISNPKIDSPKVDSLKGKTSVNDKPIDTITASKPVNNVVTYEIIGGAMKTQKKVDEIILNLSKIGVTAKTVESMPGRLIKISLGTYTDYNLAKKHQDSLKIKLKNPKLYIQTIKPKN